MPVLITLAAVWFGDATTVVAAPVYGLSLIAHVRLLGGQQHGPRCRRCKDLLRRIDQSAIYVKIAGSYTPFAVLTGTHAGLFLAGVWGAALAGASRSGSSAAPAEVGEHRALPRRSAGPAALAGGPLVGALTPTGFALILAAGCLYTLGVVFFIWERLPFHNTIWHVFVLAASFVLYAAVLVELWGRAAALIRTRVRTPATSCCAVRRATLDRRLDEARASGGGFARRLPLGPPRHRSHRDIGESA